MAGYALVSWLRHQRDSWRRETRRWCHVSIVLLSAMIGLLSFAQLFLSVLLFSYLDIPQCLMVGQTLALVASILCLLCNILYYALTRRFRGTRGLRNRQSLSQNAFYYLISTTTLLWWLGSLNGAFIFGFNKSHIGCPPSPIASIGARVASACGVYQVSLSTSVPAFICSSLQLFLFLRCKRPFLPLKAVFRIAFNRAEDPERPANAPDPEQATARKSRLPSASLPGSVLVSPVGSIRRPPQARLSPRRHSCPSFDHDVETSASLSKERGGIPWPRLGSWDDLAFAQAGIARCKSHASVISTSTPQPARVRHTASDVSTLVGMDPLSRRSSKSNVSPKWSARSSLLLDSSTTTDALCPHRAPAMTMVNPALGLPSEHAAEPAVLFNRVSWGLRRHADGPAPQERDELSTSIPFARAMFLQGQGPGQRRSGGEGT